MKSKFLLAVSALVFVAAACNQKQSVELKPFVTINQHRVNIEIAETDATRQKGLGGRTSLGADEGMLFIFPTHGKHSFWMKDTLMPLDFIWISNGKVIDITANVEVEPDIQDNELEIYSPMQDVNWVLEVNAGWVERNGVDIGDVVELTR